MPSLVYKVLLEVYSRVSLAAEHRLHPAELAEQIREGYALHDQPAMRADLRVPSVFAERLSSSPTMSADVPKLASTGPCAGTNTSGRRILYSRWRSSEVSASRPSDAIAA